MDWAVNTFKARKEIGIWRQRSSKEETITAFQGQINQLMKKDRAVAKNQEWRGLIRKIGHSRIRSNY
jgi:hypothetical protein